MAVRLATNSRVSEKLAYVARTNSMPKLFPLTDWLRRHPLTVLLLAATLCVDAVAVVLAMNHAELVNLMLFALLMSQISLLCWWASNPGRMQIFRFASLLAAVGLCSYISTKTTRGPPFAEVLAFFSVQSFAILIAIWTWRLLSKDRLRTDRNTFRFSMLRLFEVMTLCAIAAALLSFANFKILTTPYTLFLVANVVVFGVVGPGPLFHGWPSHQSWAWPLVVGVLCAIALTRIVPMTPPYFFWIHNTVAAILYSIWGTHLWGSANRPHSALTPLAL